MEIIARPSEVRHRVQAWRAQGQRVAFVPTMGNLHAGHAALVQLARKQAERVVVSVFVNPLQFGPNEDFQRYPRTPADDRTILESCGADALFLPEVSDIYPAGMEGHTIVQVPGLSEILCGEFRPGHFEGVATVVAKLFNIVQPDMAFFGEKDFQQLAVIKRMTIDLCLPLEVVGAPTVREADGLAMSSRNRYLTPEQRQQAPAIYAALRAAVQTIEKGGRDFVAIEGEGARALQAAGMKPDYFSVRNAVNLMPPTQDAQSLVVLTAARLGRARLIDNLRV
jgi:pantoate--beta-alanine ligase